jgi:hypothetical protein
VTAFYVPLLAVLFFACGNFGLLNVIGDRRTLQVVLLAPLGLLLPLLWRRRHAFVVDPLFALAVIYLCSKILRGASPGYLGDAVLAVVLVAVVDAMGPARSLSIARGVVVIAAVFSSMVILQAVAVATEPGLSGVLTTVYTSDTADKPIEVSHALNYLGFLQPVPVFIAGREFPRFMSFASEPSVLIYSFLAPALLAFGAPGALVWAALPLALFVGILAASGTVWLSIITSAALWPILRIFVRRRWLAVALPFMVTAAGLGIVLLADVPAIIFGIAELSSRLSEVYTAVDKTGSASVRLQWMAETFWANASSLWGTKVEATESVGALLGSYVRAGVVGAVAAVAVYVRLFARIARCVDVCRGRERIMSVLLFGTLTQVMVFSEYGWASAPGFMMLALLAQTTQVSAERAESELGPAALLARSTPSRRRRRRRSIRPARARPVMAVRDEAPDEEADDRVRDRR